MMTTSSTSIFARIASFVSGFWKTDLEPWLVDFGHQVEHDVVTQLIPLAAEAFAEIGTIAGGAGTISQKAAAAGSALALLGQKAEASAITATVHDLSTALASVSATITAGAAAANTQAAAIVASIPAPTPST